MNAMNGKMNTRKNLNMPSTVWNLTKQKPQPTQDLSDYEEAPQVRQNPVGKEVRWRQTKSTSLGGKMKQERKYDGFRDCHQRMKPN